MLKSYWDGCVAPPLQVECRGVNGWEIKREIIESLEDIYNGGSPMSPHIARKIIHHLQEHSSTENLLTPREQDVLRQLEKGLSYKEAASELNISPHTVHSYIKASYEKVQASSRQELLHKARRLGWL